LIGRRAFASGGLALAASRPARAQEKENDEKEKTWIDAHTHVFIRSLKAYVGARYVPNYDASWQALLALAAQNKVGRAVILQPSFLGFDNSYLMEALKAEPGRLRGVPWISPSVEVSADRWEEMARLGVRGLRFPIFGLPTPNWRAYDTMLAEALRRDWPIHLYAEARRLPDILPALLDAGHKLVIPHFGMFDRTLGPLRDPGFELLLQKASTGRIWVVLCGDYRVGPERARAAAPLLLASFGPERLMWGSDWPHTDTDLDRVTTYPKTLQGLDEWVPDAAKRQTILVDTPAKLYGF
jgi:predicted TIM-barrel fold metal-dependent hydrolase